MSHEEKWQTLEWIQEALEEEDPSWLEPLLQQRRREFENGKVELLTLEQVEDRHRARKR